ncbi:MAG TPA: hypothetical protein VF364_06605 [Candidatus Limnocylindria bacterium]
MVIAALVTFGALLIAWVFAPQGNAQETSTAEEQAAIPAGGTASTRTRTSGLRSIIRRAPRIGHPAANQGPLFTE